MLHVAIIGSGPAGYYTAEALLKLFGDEAGGRAAPGGVRIDIVDRLPTPFGLIRAGVAPDHQAIKAVTQRYEATALSENVRFVGNVEVGEGVSVDELRSLYHAVVIATGAPSDRRLGVPGEELPGVIGSAAFVGWYNGHPDFTAVEVPVGARVAAVIGNGNVALDVARILAKRPDELEGSDIALHAAQALEDTRIEAVHIIGRRGPHQVSFSPKELGELELLAHARPVVRPRDLPPEESDRSLEPWRMRSVGLLRRFAAGAGAGGAIGAGQVELRFDFNLAPVAIEGDGRVERLVLERTRVEGERAIGTGERVTLDCELVVPCIGYRTNPIPGVPYDADLGRFANDGGRIAPGLYCVGWARRGPTGTIGTNRPDGFSIAERIAEDVANGAVPGEREGRAGLDRLIAERDLYVVTFRDWQKIDAAEVARARVGRPREKIVGVDELLDIARGR